MPVDGGRPRKRILIVSARIGAGHDGAARAIATRLAEHDVEHADFLDLLPGRLGQRLCDAYHRQLSSAPRTWNWLLTGLGTPGMAALAIRLSWLAGDNLLARADRGHDLVVSTYPLASHAMARLRATGRSTTPFAVYLTDPWVHRLSVCPTADLHIAANPTAAAMAQRFGASWVEIAAPVVAPMFRPAVDTAERGAARDTFGLPDGRRLALVVAGSWGVGRVAEIARDVAASGTAVPVVVCGRNDDLLHRLRQAGYRHVFGWVDDMPGLIRACDVVLQNAGGLTTYEALASGLPVLTYLSLPGHGKANAKVLDREGIVPWVRNATTLPTALTGPPPAPLTGQDPGVLLDKLLAVT
ncbi:MAG TPA: hypothetical protein VHV49_03905 [Pseudonocardiaceae bacterium]|nr:hypothetical protein [Pseudonocardiaceae bacterium]